MPDLGDFLFGSQAQKYDNTTQQAQDARTIEGKNTAYDTTAAQAQGANMGNYGADRGQQQGLVGSLTNASNGQGPSAAQMAGQQSRDASLSQAAALQAGRRGQDASAGARMGAAASSAGIQQADQTQAQGQANEMATARGQLAGVEGQMSNEDLGAAQMQQQNQEFNAGAQNNTAAQNQQAQLGIANAELQARQKQEGYSYSNLQPAQQGLFSPANVTTLLAAGAKAAAAAAKGGFFSKPTVALIGEAGPEIVVPLSPGHEDMQDTARLLLSRIPSHGHGLVGRIPHMAQGGGAGMSLPTLDGGEPRQNQGPGPIGANGATRVNPNWGANSPAAFGNALGSVASKALLVKAQDLADKKQKREEDDKTYNDMLKRNGGFTDLQIKNDPKAAAQYYGHQADVEKARTDAFAQRGLGPDGRPVPPVTVNVPGQTPASTDAGPTVLSSDAGVDGTPPALRDGAVIMGHPGKISPGLLGALHDVHARLTRLESRKKF